MDRTPIILKELEILRKGELLNGQPTSHFKALAYKKVIDKIRDLKHPIFSYEDVKEIPGIGIKIATKIMEIIETGKLEEAKRVEETYDIASLNDLITVHGIGPVKAQKLIEDGINNVSELSRELEKNPKLLNDTQKMGLKYNKTALLRIPRSEMKKHEKILKENLPEGLTGELVGSYRRGTKNSGDIDMLLTYPSEISQSKAEKLFKLFVTTLIENGYILDKLVFGNKKYMGYVSINKKGKARRLDLLLTPPSEYAYSLLYFTGSGDFNVAFRSYANLRGYTLNEHKMVPLKEFEVPKVPIMNNEKDIFDFLGLLYIEPEERIDENQIIMS
jgi:DNA polymerase/3'-5' exonuclease PolX